jgi:hypothetical protein
MVGGAYAAAWVCAWLIVDALPPSTVRDLLIPVCQVGLLSSIALGSRAYGRALPSAGVIVWLRRFHVRRSKHFAAILERAAAGVGYPVTLQDSSYSTSLNASIARSILLPSVLFLLWPLGAMVVAFLVLEAFGEDSGILANGVLVAALIGFSAAMVKAIALSMKRNGIRTLSDDVARREFSTIMGSAGRGRRGLVLGVEVLKVSDAAWQELVQEVLAGSVLTVIDVTDITDNIRTEMAAALRSPGPERIILAAEEGSADPARIWREVVAPVRGSIPVDPRWVASALFTYPASRPGFDLRVWSRIAELRQVMTDRLPGATVAAR